MFAESKSLSQAMGEGMVPVFIIIVIILCLIAFSIDKRLAKNKKETTNQSIDRTIVVSFLVGLAFILFIVLLGFMDELST